MPKSRPQSYNGDSYEPFDRTAGTEVTRQIGESSKTDFSKPLATCPECGGRRQFDVELLGVMRRMPVACRCRNEEMERDKQRDERDALERRVSKFRAYSLMDEHFTGSTFENWVHRDDNKGLYEFGKRYCDSWDDVSANNHGVLLHGEAGNGKTYLSFAIANELYRQGKIVLAISVSRILRIISDSYSRNGDVGELEVMNTLYDAGLLILDDLGVEHKTAWSYDKLYTIIDTRYRAKKPTIITTNLRIDDGNRVNELRNNLAIVDAKTGHRDPSDRIYNRLVEMCAFIEVAGKSWRIQKGEENKAALFSKLGLGGS